MDKKSIFSEIKIRVKTKVDSVSSISNDLKELVREVELEDQLGDNKTFFTIEEFRSYVKENNGKTIDVIRPNNDFFRVKINLEKIDFKNVKQESEPAVLNQYGVYLTPPHGELIWNGKKRSIIKSIKLEKHINEPIYLLSGNLVYGIINIGEPKQISLSQFKELSSSHKITDEERIKWWPDAKSLYYYPVTFIRRYSPPREWNFKPGTQMFVKDVKFSETSNVAKYIFAERASAEKEDENRQEAITSEMDRFGDWYKIKANPNKQYRYVAQHHIRGDSVHTDLRMEVNDHLVGLTLDTPGSTTSSIDKFLDPISPSQGVDYQILTELKLIQPPVWLTVKGKIPPGGIGATKFKPAEFKIISSGTVKFGTQKHDFHEFFLHPDKKWGNQKLAGRWIVAEIPKPAHYQKAGEGKMMWAMFKPNDQRPYVEYQDYNEAVNKAKKENGYLIWQHPTKGELSESVDFRPNKKSSWVYK